MLDRVFPRHCTDKGCQNGVLLGKKTCEPCYFRDTQTPWFLIVVGWPPSLGAVTAGTGHRLVRLLSRSWSWSIYSHFRFQSLFLSQQFSSFVAYSFLYANPFSFFSIVVCLDGGVCFNSTLPTSWKLLVAKACFALRCVCRLKGNLSLTTSRWDLQYHSTIDSLLDQLYFSTSVRFSSSLSFPASWFLVCTLLTNNRLVLTKGHPRPASKFTHETSATLHQLDQASFRLNSSHVATTAIARIIFANARNGAPLIRSFGSFTSHWSTRMASVTNRRWRFQNAHDTPRHPIYRHTTARCPSCLARALPPRR